MPKWLTAMSGTLVAMLMLGCGAGLVAPVPELSVRLSASPTTIKVGDKATLTWSSKGADSVSIDHGVGSLPPSGSVVVAPSNTTTYTAMASAQWKKCPGYFHSYRERTPHDHIRHSA